MDCTRKILLQMPSLLNIILIWPFVEISALDTFDQTFDAKIVRLVV